MLLKKTIVINKFMTISLKITPTSAFNDVFSVFVAKIYEDLFRNLKKISSRLCKKM